MNVVVGLAEGVAVCEDTAGLKVVSVNVLTVRPADATHGPSLRRACLERLSYCEGFGLVGLQETKSRQSVVLSGEHFYMVGGRRGEDGRGRHGWWLRSLVAQAIGC